MTSRSDKFAASVFAALLLSAGVVCGRGLPDSARVEAERHYESGIRLLDVGDARGSLECLSDALALDNDHVPALVGSGHAHLRLGDLKHAEDAFLLARRKDRRYAPAHNGLGLVYLDKQKGLQWAVQYFRDAIQADRGYAEAYYNLARAFHKLGDTKELVAYRRLSKVDPSHPDVWFQIGRIHKEGEAGERVDYRQAEAALRRQLEVHAEHAEARIHLGEVLKELGKTEEAVSVLAPLAEDAGPHRRRALLELAEVHQRRREFDRASSLFEDYLASLSESDRLHFYDLSLVAAGEDLARFKRSSEDEWPALAGAFWAGRDPAPVTASNERLLEHYRRVAYALEHFGTFAQPWDTRGEIYIRYGRPDHVSRSEDIRFETESDVVAVKERLIHQAGRAVSGLLRVRNAETTSYGGQPGDLGDPSVLGPASQMLLELAESGSYRTDDGGTTESAMGGASLSGGELPHQAELRMGSSILGWPVYPVVGKVWEYWIYTGVGRGVEITFTQDISRAPFRFANMPVGKGGHSNTLFTWQRMNPGVVISRVISHTPERYTPDFVTAPLDFFFDVARFRGASGLIDLEVYYGIPNWELTFEDDDSGRGRASLVHGVALFDSQDSLVHRSSDPVVLLAAAASDTGRRAYFPEVTRVAATPGAYRLSVQVLDESSGRSQVYNQEVDLRPYGDAYLRLSDIELASLVRPADSGKFVKGEVEVIPNPTRTYYPGQSVFVYYEVYNLRRNAYGETQYRVRYEVRSLDQVSVVARILGGLGRLLGMQQDTSERVSIEYEHAGETAGDYGYLELDLSKSDPGEQILRVHVEDVATGASTEASTTFTIKR